MVMVFHPEKAPAIPLSPAPHTVPGVMLMGSGEYRGSSPSLLCFLDWIMLPAFQILTCAGRGARLMLWACFARKSALVEMDGDRWRMWHAP